MKPSPQKELPREINVFVVIPPHVLLLDIAGPLEVLRKANQLQQKITFIPHYIGPQSTEETSIGLSLSGILPLPANLPPHAWLILPGATNQPMQGNEMRTSHPEESNNAITHWIQEIMRPDIFLISICSGALLAAKAGMLDHHQCTTHHDTMATLKHLAPSAIILENRLYVIDGARASSAGISAGVDLMLYLMMQKLGAITALNIARYLLIYLRRGGDDPQLSPWLEGRSHIHPLIHQAQDIISKNPQQRWSGQALAQHVNATPRTLERLFTKYTGMSLGAYITHIRLAKARELLQNTALDIELIAEQAGFSSARHLRHNWGKFNKAPPTKSRLKASAKTQQA